MTVALWIGFSLVLAGVLSLIVGMFTIYHVDMQEKQKKVLFAVTIFAFLLCFGYGVMNLSRSHADAYWARCLGLVGLYGYVICIVRFIKFYCGKVGKKLDWLWILDCVMGVLCVAFMGRPDEVTFVKTNYGTAFETDLSEWRYFAGAYILANIFCCMFILVGGLRRARFRREVRIIAWMMVVGGVTLALTIMDMVFPIIGILAFPVGCYGVFVGMLLICITGLKMNAFSITKSNMSKYIFENVDTPVLILDDKRRIIMANVSAEKYFDMRIPEDEVYFQDLFEITKKDAKGYIENVIGGLEEEPCRLMTRKDQAICELVTNAVLDEFKEPICIVTFVHDMTKEYQAIDKLKRVKTGLEEELEDKNKQVESMALQAITTIANFIDSKEEYTIGHSTRVAKYSAAIAREMGWNEEEVQNLYYVGLLHDVGKIAVPYEILNKPSRLNDVEYRIIKKHTTIGADILKDINMVPNVDIGARYHHERYDGTGYPEHLSGKDIPIIARIICIADAYDAMTSNRHYREHLQDEIVREELLKNSGTQFDPYITQVMVRMIDEGIIRNLQEEDSNKKEENVFVESNMLMAKLIGKNYAASRVEAENDMLTNVWNRSFGEKHIREYLHIGDGALMIIDMDNFKTLNDEHGHLMGDMVLCHVADILKMHSKNEFLCRLSGDEFLLFIRDVKTEEEVRPIIDSIMYTFHSKIEEADILRQTSLSIGVALSSREGKDFQVLVRCADRALYYIKQNGKNGYGFHNHAELGCNRDVRIDFDRLVSTLKNKDESKGPFQVGYQHFMNIHEFVEKYAARNNQPIQLVMMTLDFDNSKPMVVEERNRVMRDLEQSVAYAARGVDISTRFSSSQILLILVDTLPECVDKALNRFTENFYLKYKKEDISILVDSHDISAK